ncbi:hypothetical protein GPALN_012503 [Globodera pallida]|nr:hypothetical protein GPALN_012503 [Globodera pallida]
MNDGTTTDDVKMNSVGGGVGGKPVGVVVEAASPPFSRRCCSPFRRNTQKKPFFAMPGVDGRGGDRLLHAKWGIITVKMMPYEGTKQQASRDSRMCPCPKAMGQEAQAPAAMMPPDETICESAAFYVSNDDSVRGR